MTVDQLNEHFGHALGRPDGVRPRFAWMWRPGMLQGSKQWFLCQLLPNPFTEDQWHALRPREPFPGKLRWVQHFETKLPAGVDPTMDHTAFYVRTLRKQMEDAELAAKQAEAGRKDDATIAAEAEALKSQEKAAEQFSELVGDWEPVSWKLGEPHDPGDKDGPVAFQVGGSRDDQSTPAV